MEDKKDTFTYTYSSKEQEEIQAIRKKYLPKEEDKMEQLRRLDRGAARTGPAVSITVGVLGCLLLGVGMCCSMVWMAHWFIPGIILGILGMAAIALAYPLYNHITKKEREKIAPQILKLTEELADSE